jgi:hypothetical protein
MIQNTCQGPKGFGNWQAESSSHRRKDRSRRGSRWLQNSRRWLQETSFQTTIF